MAAKQPQPPPKDITQVSAVRDLLDELAGRLDARSVVQDELFAEIKKTQESVSEVRIEMSAEIAKINATAVSQAADLDSLKRYRENFWTKVIATAAAVSTLIAAVAAGLAVLMK